MNFPAPAYSDDRLVDYGTPFAVDVRFGASNTMEIIPQKLLSCSSGLGLFPSRPSMPLLPPNDYVNLLKEPCMENKKRYEKNLRYIKIRFLYGQTNIKKPFFRSRLERLLGRLDILEDIDDEFKAREFYSLLSEPRKNFQAPKGLMSNANFAKSFGKKDFVEVDINSDYTGGCVSYHPFDDGAHGNTAGVLLYPCGRDLSSLCFRQASFTPNHRFQLDDTNSVMELPDDGRIFETKVATAQQQTFAICRQSRRCSIFQLDSSNCVSDGFARPVMSHEWPEDDRPSSVSISPFIASEFLVSTKNGSVYLWSPQSTNGDNKPRLVHQGDGPDTTGVGCHFGGHPRLAVVATRTSVTLHDIGRSRLPSELLQLPHQCFHEGERVMVMAKVVEPFYHFIAMDSHVVVMDERKPNDPVLVWKPWFLSPPQYLSVLAGVLPSPAVDDLLIVGTQYSAETFCFQFHPARAESGGSYPFQGCGNYWRASRADCFSRFSTRQGFGRYSTVSSSRLEVPLAGVCGIPHGAPGKQGGVSIVQMTSFGDLFCQDYSVESDEVTKNKTFCYGPGSSNIGLSADDLRFAANWLDRARVQFSDTIAKDVDFYSDYLNVSTVFQDMLPKCEPLSACCLCNRHWDRRRPASTVDDSDLCHGCNMTVADSRAMVKAIEEGRPIPMPTDFSPSAALESEESLRDLVPESYEDHESRLMMKLWKGETDIEEMLIKRDEEFEKYISTLKQRAAERQKGNGDKTAVNQDEGVCEMETDETRQTRHRGETQSNTNQEHRQELQDAEENEPEDGDATILFGGDDLSEGPGELNDSDSRDSLPDPMRDSPDPKYARLDPLESSLECHQPQPKGIEDLCLDDPAGTPPRDEPDATPRRPRLLSTSSTSSVHSVLLRSPGFFPTPSRLRQSPAPSASFFLSNSDRDFTFTGPSQRPGAMSQGRLVKRKQFGMGF